MNGAEPIWIDEDVVLALHGRLLALHGGPGGLRDKGLLQSAIARPRQFAAYGDKPDLIDLTAAYTAGIVKNHPFVDGNTRTGFVIGTLFLEMNGCKFTATDALATDAVLALAAGELDDAGYCAFLRQNVAP